MGDETKEIVAVNAEICRNAAPVVAAEVGLLVEEVQDVDGGFVVRCKEGEIRFEGVNEDSCFVSSELDGMAAKVAKWIENRVLLLPSAAYVPRALDEVELDVFVGVDRVTFTEVDGAVEIPSEDVGLSENTAEHRSIAFRRSRDLSALGPDCAHVYVAMVPAVDVKWAVSESSLEDFPAAIRRPLVKTADGTVVGYRSGGRSGILVDGSDLLRLKGCGNFVDGLSSGGKDLRFPFPGFPVAPFAKVFPEADEQAKEVRGCSFPHLCRREHVFAHRIATLLSQSTNIPTGIQPIALWNYAQTIPGDLTPSVRRIFLEGGLFY